jgi:hypothetical protein
MMRGGFLLTNQGEYDYPAEHPAVTTPAGQGVVEEGALAI